MLKNGQIFYNNLAVWAPPQDFESMFGHLTLLCVKGLKHRNEKSTAQKTRPCDLKDVLQILHLTLTLFFPMFPFDPPKTNRKAKVA